MNKTSVGQLRLRLHSPGAYARALQQRCSVWCHGHLQGELARILAQASGPEYNITTIDRLVIDVGDIPLSRFESVMSTRVAACLIRELRGMHPDREAADEGGLTEAETADEMPAAVSRGTGAQTFTASTASTASGGRPGASALLPAVRFRQLLRYLDTGVVADARPWTRHQARDQWLKETLQQIAAVNITAAEISPRVALAQSVLQPRARQRLVATWSDKMLATVCSWLTVPHHLPALYPEQGGQLLVPAAIIALSGSARQLAAYVSEATAFPGQVGVHDAPARQSSETILHDWLEVLSQIPPSPALQVPLRAWWVEQREAFSRQPLILRHQLRGIAGEGQPPSSAALRRLRGTVAAERGLLPSAVLQHPLRTVEGEGRLRPSAALRHPLRTAAVGRGPQPSATLRRPRRTDTGEAVSSKSLQYQKAARAGTAEQMRATGTYPDTHRWTADVGEDDIPGVVNAGLVLLWPLLPRLFTTAGWVKEGQFVNDTARWQALAALDWLASGEPEPAEWRSRSGRLLCGIPGDAPDETIPLDAPTLATLEDWLEEILRNVPLFARCGVNMLREWFLQRPGVMEIQGRLTIETATVDVLLHDLPWPLSPVVLPWLENLINVEWKA